MTRGFFGWRVFGLGVIALALVDLAYGNFDSGQPVPKDFPFRTVLAYAAAAFLLTIMYASFTPLVHLPILLADASKQFTWSENALNIILAGVAWVVADSLQSRRQT